MKKTLNTRQVRMLARNITGVTAAYTDRTRKNTPASKRRSVVFRFDTREEANALAIYLDNNTDNQVTRTVSYGGQYVRVKADLGY